MLQLKLKCLVFSFVPTHIHFFGPFFLPFGLIITIETGRTTAVLLFAEISYITTLASLSFFPSCFNIANGIEFNNK